MSDKIRFTKRALEAIEPPEKGRAIYRDSENKFLNIIVTSAGNKNFYLIRWHDGETHFKKLGSFPEMTVHQARRRAEECSAKLLGGEAVEKQRNQSIKFGELFQRFIDEYACVDKSNPRKKTWQDDIQRFNAHLSHWSNRKADKITGQDVKELHRELQLDRGRDRKGVKRGGPYTANRTLALIRKLYNWAQAEDILELPKGNPARKATPEPEEERNTRLEGDTMLAFWKAMDDEATPPFWFDFFCLLLLTGCRRSELQAMEWREVNFHARKWTVPAGKSKNGKEMTKMLIAEAVEILERRRAETESKFVFPSSKSKSGHIEECRKAWLKLCARGGIEGVRIHDIRRTNASFQVDTGAPQDVIAKSLGHLSQKTTARYAQAASNAVRQSMERAGAEMLNYREH